MNVKEKGLCKRHTELLGGKEFPHHRTMKHHPWAFPWQHKLTISY